MACICALADPPANIVSTAACFWSSAPSHTAPTGRFVPNAFGQNPTGSLLYNDRRAGATVIVQGRARIAEDESTRRKVFELSPEVEQTHDPDRHGVPVVIEVVRLQAGTGAGRGNFTMVRE